MDSYQVKIGCKRIRKSENKNYRSVPTRREIEIFKRIAKKFRKLKKYHYGFISVQNRLEEVEKNRK